MGYQSGSQGTQIGGAVRAWREDLHVGRVINEFSIDDLGFDVDYMSNIDYASRGPDNSELLDKNVAIAFEGPKFLETSVLSTAEQN